MIIVEVEGIPCMHSRILRSYIKKTVISLHVLGAAMWTGGALSAVLILIFETSRSSGLWPVNSAIRLIENFVIIPGAIGCFLTGLIISLVTDWGFFKHHWVGLKWVLTTLLVVFGVVFLAPWAHQMIAIAQAKQSLAVTDTEFLHYVRLSTIFGSVHFIFTVVLTVISVFRPFEDHRHKTM